jgi:hypothetical protein
MQPKKNKMFLAWLPALLVIVASIVTAAGISLIPAATAATDSENVVVSGTVNGAVSITQACGNATNFGGAGNEFTPGGTERITSDCAVGFDSNNANGVSLTVQDSNAAPFFCTGTCGGNDEFANQNHALGDVLAVGEFGIALESVSAGGCVAAACTSNAGTDMLADTNTTVVAGDDSFHAIPASGAPRKVCGTNASTGGTPVNCTVVFGGEPKAAQNSGSYTGTAVFTATTL